MKIKVGDRFVRDTCFGRLSFTILEIKYFWGRYGNLQETIVYKGETGSVWKKSRQQFEEVVKRFNARRIPKEEIGDFQSYIPRHKFL